MLRKVSAVLIVVALIHLALPARSSHGKDSGSGQVAAITRPEQPGLPSGRGTELNPITRQEYAITVRPIRRQPIALWILGLGPLALLSRRSRRASKRTSHEER